MDESLLGRPLLKCMELDLYKIVTAFSKQGKKVDVSSAIDDAINTVRKQIRTKLSKKLREARCDEMDGDTTDVMEAEDESLGVGKSEIGITSRQIIGKSAKGLLRWRRKPVQSLIGKYRDLWRFKREKDPHRMWNQITY